MYRDACEYLNGELAQLLSQSVLLISLCILTVCYGHLFLTGESEMYSYEPAMQSFFGECLSNKFNE